jgi:hypothetical protein
VLGLTYILRHGIIPETYCFPPNYGVTIMADAASVPTTDYSWDVQPDAAAWVAKSIAQLAERNPVIGRLEALLRDDTGTRLVDWVDHLAFQQSEAGNGSPRLIGELANVGYDRASGDTANVSVWRHPLGMFPPIVTGAPRDCLAIRADSAEDAVAALIHELDLDADDDQRDSELLRQLTPPAAATSSSARIDPPPIDFCGTLDGPYVQACLHTEGGVSLCITERHGYRGFSPPAVEERQIAAARKYLNDFRRRQRVCENHEEGFHYAIALFEKAAAEIGRDWACDLFFAAERDYWRSRNQAARVQYDRQNRLGLGWANHDHHTYRSSRRAFHRLIAVLEQMGFECRERFYAGREAGWGAQVLEQPESRVVIFADVDLSPDEVTQDFAHEPLSERDELGTVGLWCELHGEAFLEAGMHHLECQFDFDASCEQLAKLGVETLAPFTNFEFLRQAFTRGETWPVNPARVERLRATGRITNEQAEKFLREGAIGSHLEILERNDGYKGFNQTGINDIIRRTDPRGVVGA